MQHKTNTNTQLFCSLVRYYENRRYLEEGHRSQQIFSDFFSRVRFFKTFVRNVEGTVCEYTCVRAPLVAESVFYKKQGAGANAPSLLAPSVCQHFFTPQDHSLVSFRSVRLRSVPFRLASFRFVPLFRQGESPANDRCQQAMARR